MPYSCGMEIIEMTPFARRRDELFDEDENRD
jgi:hypothetical protein